MNYNFCLKISKFVLKVLFKKAHWLDLKLLLFILVFSWPFWISKQYFSLSKFPSPLQRQFRLICHRLLPPLGVFGCLFGDFREVSWLSVDCTHSHTKTYLLAFRGILISHLFDHLFKVWTPGTFVIVLWSASDFLGPKRR